MGKKNKAIRVDLNRSMLVFKGEKGVYLLR